MTRFVAGLVEFEASGRAREIVRRVETRLGVSFEPDRVVTGEAQYFVCEGLGLRIFLELPEDGSRPCALSYRSQDDYAGDFAESIDLDFHFERLLRDL